MSTRKDPKAERQDRNGVIVKVWRWSGEGSTVEATCECFGHPLRVHTASDCPYLLAFSASEG